MHIFKRGCVLCNLFFYCNTSIGKVSKSKPYQLKTFITKYPVAVFIGLTFFITFPVAFLLSMVLGHKNAVLNYIPQVVGPYGPALSALIITGFTLGSTGVIQLLGKLKPIVKHIWWYVLLPITGIVITSLAFIAGGVPAGEIVKIITKNPGPLAFMFLVVTLKVGIGEELGWRGWLLPKLIRDQKPIKATLFIFVVWAVWHVPWFFNTWQFLIPLLVLIFSLAIILTWLWHKVNGDILLIAIAHASVDFPEFFIENKSRGLGYDNHLMMAWAILSVIYAAIAIILYLSTRNWWHLARSTN
jgi:membrane protease YdiL (CAAX protease family)